MELESFKELRIESDESKEKAATSGLSYDDLEVVSRNSRVKTKDKMDRATNEQVLDPKTRMILFKMLSRGNLKELNGCVSTGKEANVYSAIAGDGSPAAVKVYKTSILVFKDRDKYVSGEFRFRRGYNKHNPREMVRVWAEKEFRNLSRLRAAGILSPEPVFLDRHVLVMSFFGTDGWACPRLKDAKVSTRKLAEMYISCAVIMRQMFHIANLVHGDLSEYNMLVEGSKLVVIDVSQSVEHDHPYALDFLRRDCCNVNTFFNRKGVQVLKVKVFFEYITSLAGSQEVNSYEEVVQDLLSKEENQLKESEEEDEATEEAVFLNTPIPRTLHHVEDVEQDLQLMKEGGGDSLLYRKIVGIAGAEEVEPTSSLASLPNPSEEHEEGGQVSDAESSERSDPDLEASESEGEVVEGNREGSETVELSRKEWKKKVKEEQREKRKTKVPKKVKKRRQVMARRNKG
mmetsp:Transcript_161/g.364  ORF Transcript_161/g.364 Transcript_161/m.364 type:complete len:459 (-) Transcript_161:913-2289(-)|eukprot:CAMPEP_0113956998 /NCGR_PEP_ID=MMETSP0011_2-20120614/2442_1 /TAXON_ID=101924 /ORGANISM="Rhodosorus marinus" /LENGTH=458 /DNA_ID=CAMNT_0000967345 /DNA_START=224 /DNA_END=1600 /DNA_ORIENTATION=+ /assembly_acc=CAM_ASM_000156